MADLPILFSAPMVRTLLAGTKTQTRRPMPYQDHLRQAYSPFVIGTRIFNYACEEEISRAPISKGDRLWVREEHFQFGHWEVDPLKHTATGREKWKFVPDTDEVLLAAPAETRRGRHHHDPGTPAWHKRLGRFMFRKHSRLTLYVTDVRVQRLQDISEEDARAEGAYVGKASRRVADDYTTMALTGIWFFTARAWYADLWDRINGPGAWDANPWVAAYTFAVRAGNIANLPATLEEAA